MVFYVILFLGIKLGINRSKKVQERANTKRITSFSIIISARNEAKNIPSLLKSIESLEYPKEAFEVILIDDRSTDDTRAVAEQFVSRFPLKVLLQTDAQLAPKKSAIGMGIQQSSHDVIVTTDADCVVTPLWLATLNTFYIHGADVVAAPVKYKLSVKSSLFYHLVSIDFMSLISFGAGLIGLKWPIICNGANFSYRKTSFYLVDGFSGIDHIASGDDDLLLQKFHLAKQHIAYCWQNSALVETSGPQTLTAFVNQRKRWGSKGASYPAWQSRLVMYFIYIVHLSLIVALIQAVLGNLSFIYLISLIFVKFLVELPIMIEAKKLFNPNKFWRYIPSLFFLQTPYVLLIGPLATFGTYQWKKNG
jgi:cellulose synthase/poly-beta-1,6-N-acetylglucosamine synthase-like glycosyltransferase